MAEAILIVEDEILVALEMESLLQEHGYEVELTQAQGHTAPGGVGYTLS